MSWLSLAVATVAIVSGSTSVAARLERTSLSRRMLLVGVVVPAQITGLVLLIGWGFASFRPGPLLITAVVLGGAETALLQRRALWQGPMSMRSAAGRVPAFIRHNKPVALVASVAAAFTAWQSLRAVRLPVTSWDSLWYHLPEPSSWVLAGRVGSSGLTLIGSGYPQGQEVLHGWTMVFLHSIRGTGLVPLWLAVVGALAVYRLGRHLGASGSSAVLGASVFASMPAVALQISTAYVDLGAASLGLAAMALALESRSADAPIRLLVPASVAAALAVGTKPSMAPVLVAVAVVAALVSRRRHREGVPLGSIGAGWAVAAVLALGLGGIWYVHNYVQYRNPLYPVSALGFEGAGSFDVLVRNHQAPGSIADRAIPVQLWTSWTEDLRFHSFTYDQRLGGLGAAWVLLCVPALVFAGTRLWRNDRLAAAVLGGVGLSTWLASGSGWWARYTLLLAGIGCAALALTADAVRDPWLDDRARRARRRRSARLRGPAFCGIALALVTFTTVSAITPTSEYALANSVPLRPMGAGELWSMAWSGKADRELRPWGAFTGFDDIEPGSTIAAVDTELARFPQVVQGIDLDRRYLPLDPSPTPQALRDQMAAKGAQYLLLADPPTPGALETVAVNDRLHFRRVEPRGLLTGVTLWELGSFDECVGGELTLSVNTDATRDTIAGRLTDGCGAVRGAPIEVWASGGASEVWDRARRVSASAVTTADGRFRSTVRRGSGSKAPAYFVRFGGREDEGRYRPPAASPVTRAKAR